jgi:hypothetical protein
MTEADARAGCIRFCRATTLRSLRITSGSRGALLRNACHRRLGKVASVKGGGKPSAALTVGSRAFVNPKTLSAIGFTLSG